VKCIEKPGDGGRRYINASFLMNQQAPLLTDRLSRGPGASTSWLSAGEQEIPVWSEFGSLQTPLNTLWELATEVDALTC